MVCRFWAFKITEDTKGLRKISFKIKYFLFYLIKWNFTKILYISTLVILKAQKRPHICKIRLTNACHEGYNARKVISVVYASFVLYCSVLSLGECHSLSPDMGSIFHKKSIYFGLRKLLGELSNFQNSMFYPPRILNEQCMMHLFLFTNSA